MTKRQSIRYWTPEEDEKIALLRGRGLTMREIAVALDRPYSSTNSRIHELHEAGRIQALPMAEREMRVQKSRARRTSRLQLRAENLIANVPATMDAGYVIGVIYGDGFINFKDVDSRAAKSIGLTTTDESFREAFANALGTWVGQERIKRTEHVVDAVLAPGSSTRAPKYYTNVKYFNAWLHDRHFVTAFHEKFGPTQTEAWCIDVMGAFARGEDFCKGIVQGFFDSDGTIGMSGGYSPAQNASTISRRGAASFAELLWMLGYDTYTHLRKRELDYKQVYQISLSASSSRRYCAEIGSRIGYKSDRMKAIVAATQRKLGST